MLRSDVRAILDISVSLDGYVALEDGEPGIIHSWLFDAKTPADQPFADVIMDRGAVIMGWNTFDLCYYGKAWDGPAWPAPTFVVTHRAREPLDWDGVPYTFVSGLAAALDLAKAASDGRPVQIMGGGQLAAGYMQSGLVDEIRVHIAPVLLGSGIRLFPASGSPGGGPDGPGGPGPEKVTPLRRRRVRPDTRATHLVLTPRKARL